MRDQLVFCHSAWPVRRTERNQKEARVGRGWMVRRWRGRETRHKTRRNKLKQALLMPLSAWKNSYGSTDHLDALQRVQRSGRSVSSCSGPRAGVTTASKQWVPSKAGTVVSPREKSFPTKESCLPLSSHFFFFFFQ